MLTPPPKHFKCHTAQPFPAPYEKLRQSLKYLKKNSERLWPLLFDHDACCFHVQVDSSRFFSPSTDSEVVTALGWGCVHVTELRRGQVVCLVDGGTLQLLSQVPGLEETKRRIYLEVQVHAGIWRTGLTSVHKARRDPQCTNTKICNFVKLLWKLLFEPRDQDWPRRFMWTRNMAGDSKSQATEIEISLLWC